MPADVAMPQWTPTTRELDDLDVLLSGALGPDLSGYVDPSEPGTPPLTLVLPESAAAQAVTTGELELIDPEGAPLARMQVTGTWDAGTDRRGLVGPVSRLAHNEFGPFRRLFLGPDRVHEMTPPDALISVPVRGPLTDAQLSEISATATATGRSPLLIALVGDGMPDDVSGPGLVRLTQAAAQELSAVGARVIAVSLSDHGPDFTDDLIARLGASYATSTVTPAATDEADGYPAPIAAIVGRERPPRHQRGVVFFFTGLSGSGKSTLARALTDHLLERGERTVTSLDGDVVRHHLSKGLGFSREDRETNILRIGFVAAEISRHGGVAICSPIAPFDQTREAVRQMVERAGGGFVLIHVATSLEECERRDRKGLYAKARAGLIPDFTGISSPYEEPTNALKIDTADRDIAECMEEILAELTSEGWLLS